ncbi:MAG: helix-turn-helix transcriptional regulator, partial [Turicibacter sp.]|nr:helix-turn-helix transcriptional regulator [Turicibacter sp.]
MTNKLMEMKDIIKSRRLELGLTQQELADLCHADRTTIVKWESGDIVNIKRDKLQLLSKALNVSHLALLGAEEYIPCQIDEILIYDAIYGDTLGNQIAKIKNPYPENDGQFFGIKMAHSTFINSQCFAI